MGAQARSEVIAVPHMNEAAQSESALGSGPHHQPISSFHGVLLVLAPAMAVLTTVVPLPVIPQMVQAFPSRSTEISVALAAPNLAIALAGLGLGIFGDRWPRRTLFLASFGAVAVTAPLPAVLNALPAIIIARLLTGLALGVMVTTSLALAGDYFEGRRRAFWLSAMTTVPSMLAIAGAFSSGLLGRYGWQASFWLLACGIPLFIGALFTRAPHVSQMLDAREAAGNSRHSIGVIFTVLVLLVVAALLVFPSGYEMGFVLLERGSSSPVLIGAMTSLLCLGAALGAASVRILVRWSPLMVMALCFFISTVGQFMVATSESATVLLIGAGIIGMAQGFVVPVLSMWLLEKTDGAMRGRVVGVFQSLLYLALFIGPVLARTLSVHLQSGATGMIGYSLVCLIIGALLMGVAVRSMAAAKAS